MRLWLLWLWEMMRENCIQLYLFSFLCLITSLYQLHLPMWNNLSGATVLHLQRLRCPVSVPYQSKSTARIQKAPLLWLYFIILSHSSSFLASLTVSIHLLRNPLLESRQQHLFGSLGLRVTFPPAKQLMLQTDADKPHINNSVQKPYSPRRLICDAAK